LNLFFNDFVFQSLQCLFASFPQSLESDIISNEVSRCFLRDQRFSSSFTTEGALSGVFQAVGQLTSIGSINQLVSRNFQSMLNFGGFREFLSRSAQTSPAFPSQLTDESGMSSIQFQIVSGRSGYYAVIFSSENAINVSSRLLKFTNSVTNVSISDPSVIQNANVTLNERRRVFLPSFAREKTLVARLTTQTNTNVSSIPLVATL
jgi:hypothetical protein